MTTEITRLPDVNKLYIIRFNNQEYLSYVTYDGSNYYYFNSLDTEIQLPVDISVSSQPSRDGNSSYQLSISTNEEGTLSIIEDLSKFVWAKGTIPEQEDVQVT